MKNTKILLLVLFLFSPELYSQVQSGWYWVNPQPQGHNLTSVAYLNNNIIVAVGWNGTIIRSQNGGLNWSYYRYNTFRDFRKMKFIDQSTGYAVGDSSLILKTTDSGISWSRVPYFTGEDLYDLYFFDDNTGFISSNQKILKTTNGGNNFSVTANFFGRCITFTDANTGYCGGVGVLKTTNGGINWISIGNFETYGCYFFDNNTGFITGNYYNRKTTNGGSSWSMDTAFSYNPITSLDFVNPSTGFAAPSNSGYFYKTINGGLNWLLVPFQNQYLYSTGFDFLDVNNVISIGRYGLIEKTSNGGNSWQSLSNILYSSLEGISFPNSVTGFAAGYKYFTNKSIFKTTDQGNNWFELVNAPDLNFKSVYFLDVNTGFAGGYNSEVYKTTNSGTNWNFVTLQENNKIYDIKFINATTGFICSSNAVVYKTTNTGTNWIRVNFDANSGHLFKLFFPTALVGYATGEALYKTTNGGNNWMILQTPISSNINWSLYFFNESTGILGGHFGEISRTTDGGTTWTTIETNLQYALMNIKFVNNSTGYIVGTASVFTSDLGLLLKTTNNGISWQRQNLIANLELNDICFINETTGFIAGRDGLILKTTTGGEYIGINQITTEIPLNYHLKQNYPNPFNPVTNIKFDIPRRSKVKISIYDILGKEISVLVNEELNPGTFEVNWDASSFPSGVYFYKIVTDSYSESKKMVLVK